MKTDLPCSSCGTVIPDGAKFCPVCGTATQPSEQFCPACGTVAPATGKFCTACGASLQPQRAAVCPVCSCAISVGDEFCGQCGAPLRQTQRVAPPKRASAKRIRAIIRSSVLLFVAIFMLIAAFLPIANYTVPAKLINLPEDDTCSIGISAVDNIVMMVDAAIDKTNSELKNDQLTYKYEELLAELREIDFDDRLSRADMRAMTRFSKIFMRLALRSEEIGLTASFIFPAVLSLLYIAFAALLFALALTQFIRTLKNKQTREKRTVKLFLLAPFFIILTYFFTQNTPMPSIDGITCSMGWSLPALILACLAAVYFIVDRYVFGEKKPCVRLFVSSSLCLALSVIALCLCFGPALKLGVSGSFQGSVFQRTATATMQSEFFLEFEPNDIMTDGLAEMTTENISQSQTQLSYGSTKDVRDGTQYSLVSRVVLLTAYWWYGADEWSIFTVTFFAALLASILFTVCAWRSLVSLYDRPAKKSLIALSFSALAPLAAYLTLNLLFVYGIDRAFHKYEFSDVFSIDAAAAPVVLLIIAVHLIAAVFVLPRFQRTQEGQGNTTLASIESSGITNQSNEEIRQ